MTHYIWTPDDPLAPADVALVAPIGSMTMFAGGIPGTPVPGPQGDPGAPAPHLPYEPGAARWYALGPPNATDATISPSADLPFVTPFVLLEDADVTGLAVRVTTAGDATRTIRLGIYEDNGSARPSVLLVDGGTVTADATGARSVTFAAVALTAGAYWVAFAQQGSGALATFTRSSYQGEVAGTSAAGALVTPRNGRGYLYALPGAFDDPIDPGLSGSLASSNLPWVAVLIQPT